MRRTFGLIAVLVALVGAEPAAAGALRFDVVLPGTFVATECVAGNAQARCFLVDIAGLVPGLGRASVHERVFQSGEMDLELCEPQTRQGIFRTARGTVEYLASGIDCPATREQSGGYRAVVADWRIVGGTGPYAGASGRGQESVRVDGNRVFIHLHGDVVVDGLEFDTTRPVLGSVPGAIRVRSAAPTAVRYRLPTGRDALDGHVPVRCTPPSGSRFSFGRTIVRCEAVDASGNAVRASFAVVVVRMRARP